MLGIKLACNVLGQKNLYEVFTDIAHNGLLTVPAANDVLRILPPLTINFQEIDEGVDLLDSYFMTYG